MTDKSGGYAYPCKVKQNTSSDPLATPKEVLYPGMTRRDYFAGQALVGMLASNTPCGEPAHEIVAIAAFIMADAMIKESG